MSYICTMYVPWFGELPFYADTFIACCGNSPKIRWVVHSDQLAPPELPYNISWKFVVNPSRLIQLMFPAAPVREWKHKLCDLKPFWWKIFGSGDDYSEFNGWCDWDVVHNLSGLEFEFSSAKFTAGPMCSPLFIQRTDDMFWASPRQLKEMLASPTSWAWDEAYYLTHVNSTIMQVGMTPEVDLKGKAEYAVHMYKAKHIPELYQAWIIKHCNFKVG